MRDHDLSPKPENRFRAGYGPLGGVEGLVREAHWSDAFFNYVPAEQNWEDANALLEVAKEFVDEVHPDECPYTSEFLVWEFYNRL